jgi:DinB family protein
MPDKSLTVLLDEVRGKTLHLLQEVTRPQAVWAPPGLQNTILWHAGHSFMLAEWLTMKALGREPQLPEGWFEMFSWESRPALVASDRWPPLAEVITELKTQHLRLRHVIGALTDEELDRPSLSNPHRTVRSSIVHGLHDEACHSGEIYLLRKLQTAQAIDHVGSV